METALQQLETQFAELEASLAEKNAPSYAEVVEAMEVIESPLEYSWGVVGHLMGVQNSDGLRAAHSEMQPGVVQATSQLTLTLALTLTLTLSLSLSLSLSVPLPLPLTRWPHTATASSSARLG